MQNKYSVSYNHMIVLSGLWEPFSPASCACYAFMFEFIFISYFFKSKGQPLYEVVLFYFDKI